MSALSADQVQAYQRDGFLVLPEFVPTERCGELRDAALALADAWQPGGEPTVFTTDEQARVSTREFLASGRGVSCFFEEDAFGADGELRRHQRLSINKIGHATHDLDPTFRAFSYTPELAAVASDLGMPDAVALQSMYIFKQPHIGGEVGCHQDATFLYTDPVSVIGFWFAIEDATVDNGCLWAAPGAHRTSLRKQFRRTDRGADVADDTVGTEFVVLDATPLPDPSALIPLEVAAGTMVALHGLLPHWSDVNRSATSRHAYSLHCVSAAATYPAWNWLQRTADLPFRTLS